jgi:hypothetical protein
MRLDEDRSKPNIIGRAGTSKLGRSGAAVDVLMILAFVIAIVVCLWLISRALKSKDN